MSTIKIKVGAALDPNALTVFVPMEKAAQKARDSIQKSLGGVKIPKPDTSGAQAATKALADTAKTQADRMVKDVARAARERVAAEKAAMKEVESELKSHNARRKRLEDEGGDGGGGGGRRPGRFARRVGYWSMRNFAPVTPTLDIGRRIAGDVVRGAGIRTDMSSYVSSYIGRSKTAADIANSGYLEPNADQLSGKAAMGANNVRVNSSLLMHDAAAAANVGGYDPTEALAGLQQFTAITGDLETGRKTLGDMAKFAAATGSSLADVVTAAGEISAKLPEGTDKAKTLHAVMLQLSQAGKLGAVEMRDMAKQLGAVAAVAPQFEGDVAANIGMLGAMMQEARQKGGAKSAPQAATAIMAFNDNFSKHARVDAFKAITGRTYIGDNDKMRSPEELILESLKGSSSSGMGETYDMRMSKIFASTQARRSVRGFENTFKEAYGATDGSAQQKQAAGLQAVHAEFQRLGASMSQKTLDDALAKVMEEPEKKAQLFQNRLQEVADVTTAKLLPALEKLAPLVERGAAAFGDFLVWATDHPGQAVATALGASIAKAGIENTIRHGIEMALTGAGPGGTPGAGGKMGVVGAIGAAGAIAAVAYTAVQIGTAYIDNFFAKKVSEEQAARDASTKGVEDAMTASISGSVTEAKLKELQDKQRTAEAEMNAADDRVKKGPGFLDSQMIGLLTPLGMHTTAGDTLSKDVQARAEQEARNARKTNDEMVRILKRIADGGIKVIPAGGTSADPAGRTPAKGQKPGQAPDEVFNP